MHVQLDTTAQLAPRVPRLAKPALISLIMLVRHQLIVLLVLLALIVYLVVAQLLDHVKQVTIVSYDRRAPLRMPARQLLICLKLAVSVRLRV